MLKKRPSKEQLHTHNRNMIADLAIAGAKKGACGKMCSSCAFKRDSPANLEPHNVDAAISALHVGQFNCHIETGVDSGQPCAGFKSALKAMDDDRQLQTYTPKNVFSCPSCEKKHGDKKDKYWKACLKNKKGYTRATCNCGQRLMIIYNDRNYIEAFSI